MVKTNELYQSLHNSETAARVEDALIDVGGSRFDRISVVAFCGIVELSGVVSDYYDKAIAMGIARRVTGVSTVVESIQIQQSTGVPRPKLQRRARPALVSHLSMNDRAPGRLDLSSG